VVVTGLEVKSVLWQRQLQYHPVGIVDN